MNKFRQFMKSVRSQLLSQNEGAIHDSRGKRIAVAPRLESLENRCCPAFSGVFIGSVFVLSSDAESNEVVSIAYDPTAHEFVFNFTPGSTPLSAGDFSTFDPSNNRATISQADANVRQMSAIDVSNIGFQLTLQLTVGDLTGADVDVPTFDYLSAVSADGSDVLDASAQINPAIDMFFFSDAGDDTIFGGAGDDALEGGTGNDLIDGGAGDDYILGGSGDDTLRGGAGDDFILGDDPEIPVNETDGDDLIDGGSGNDTLTGNGGADTLTGGPGVDQFFAADSQQDILNVQDFEVDSLVDGVNFDEGLDIVNVEVIPTFTFADIQGVIDLTGQTSLYNLDFSPFDGQLVFLIGAGPGSLPDGVTDYILFDTDFINNILGGDSDDLFQLINGATVGSDGTGTLNGGGGTDTIDYTQFGSPAFAVVPDGPATGTGGITSIEIALGADADPPSEDEDENLPELSAAGGAVADDGEHVTQQRRYGSGETEDPAVSL